MIPRRLLMVLEVFLGLATAVVEVQASFEDYLTGGRATGVDGAMTSVADDVFSLYYNPAGAAFLKRPEAGVYMGRLYAGLSDDSNLTRSFLGYAHPKRGQSLGVSYEALSLDDIYKEEMVGMSYAGKLGESLSLGMTAKYYRKHIGHDFNTDNAESGGMARQGVSDPVFQDGHDASAWGGDVGALYHAGGGWQTGLMVRNVNEPNVALGRGATDPAPRSWALGLSRQWNDQAVMLDGWYGRFTQMEKRLHGGYERWWFHRHLGTRAGGGLGERDYQRITFGLSYRWSLAEVDYGVMIPFGTVSGTIGTHQVSLIFRFGQEPGPPLMDPGYNTDPLLGLSNEPSPESRLVAAMEPAIGESLRVDVMPSEVTLPAGASQSFQTRVFSAADHRVYWSVTPPLGTVSQEGVYQAPPEVLFTQDVLVTAKSEAAHRMIGEHAVVHLQSSREALPLLRPMKVEFDGDRAEVRPVDYPEVEKLAVLLRQYPQVNAVIEGHTDNSGSPELNQTLSEKRARAVANLLVDRFGINPRRLTAQGFGGTRPISFNRTEAERRMNRRVVAILDLPGVAQVSLAR